MQIGFIPRALSQKPQPYQHHWSPQGGNISTGWAYPPSDYRLPVLNVFRMLGLMGGRRVKVESSADAGVETLRLHGVRQGPEIMALAGLEDRTLGVLVWHYHDDDLPGPDAAVELLLRGLPVQAGSVLAARPDRPRPQQRL